MNTEQSDFSQPLNSVDFIIREFRFSDDYSRVHTLWQNSGEWGPDFDDLMNQKKSARNWNTILISSWSLSVAIGSLEPCLGALTVGEA